MIEQTYRIDMIPDGAPVVVHVSQYDTAARRLSFELYNGGVAYELPAGAVASIAGTKPDNTSFLYAMTVSGNLVSIDLLQQMALVAGDVPAEIQITGAEGKIGSANFIIRVERGPIDENSVISETDLPIFEQLVSDAQTAASEAQAAAEDAVDAAESVGSIVPASAGTTGQVLTKTANGADWADKYPSGGTAGQVLTKTANGEAWEDVDGLPAGGTAGQVLTKNSSTDGDASWQTQQSGGGTWGSITGTLSDQTDLQNALNAKANTNAIESERTARQNADNTLQGNINSEASTRASADSNLQSQINQIIAPSGEAPSAAEVQNARIGADNVTYPTLGDAIRTQNANLKNDINQMQYEVSITSVTDSTPQYIPFYIEKGSSITVKTADGNALTNATFYAFDSSKIEIEHWSLPSSMGNQRTFSLPSSKDCYSIRIKNNDGASRDYIVVDNNKLTAKDLNKIQNSIDALNGKYLSTMNCDSDLTAGRYRVATMSGTLPNGFNGSNVILENNVYDGWVVQKLYHFMRPDEIYARYIRISNPQYVWHKLIDGNGAKSGANIDQLLETGNYTVRNPTGTLPDGYDSTIAILLNITGYGENGLSDNTPRYIMQTLCSYNNPSIKYCRIIDSVYLTKTEWSISSSSTLSGLSGKKIVCFGDSITGNFQPPNDYPTMLASLTGATVYNLGVGGATMAAIQSEERVAFSFVKLVDSIVADDYSVQENSGLTITYASETDNGFVDTDIDYIPTRINTLKSIDWEDVDYITVAYGTNDWSNGHNIDNPNNLLDTTTVLGALRYSLDKLLTAYPQLKVLVISPTWRFDPSATYKDSDTWELYGHYLYEIADGEVNVCKQFHYHMYNQYYECGFNKPNRFEYFFENDGTHPKLYGRQTMATKIANELLYSTAR